MNLEWRTNHQNIPLHFFQNTPSPNESRVNLQKKLETLQNPLYVMEGGKFGRNGGGGISVNSLKENVTQNKNR